MNTSRIALISATPAAIGPAVAGLADAFPTAEPWNLLDDRLLADAAGEGGLTAPLAERMRSLIDYAITGGADGILLTCSLYGPVTETVDATIPVLAPDAAAFGQAITSDYRKILVVASFASALSDSVQRFSTAAQAAGSPVETLGAVATDAFDAANSGDSGRLAAALTSGCRPYVGQVDAILLAQYSLAPAAAQLRLALDLPVISGPHAAAAALRKALAGSHT